MNNKIDFNAARESKLEEKRRKTERIFFKQLLNVYSVSSGAQGDQLRPIEMIDVSEDGCSFRVPYNTPSGKPNTPWPNSLSEPIPLRLYFSQDTYLLVHMYVANSRPAIEDGVKYVRYGCKVDPETSSYAAYLQFVKFLKLYSEQAHKDKGDFSIFYI